MNLGYKFEVDEVDFWRRMFPSVKDYIFRVEGSGRSKNATKTGSQSLLEGDVAVGLKKGGILPKDILIECKHHKSRTVQKSFAVKKEWVDQALHEAEKNGRLSIVAVKFKGVRPNHNSIRKYCWYNGHFGNSVHYVIPQHHFIEIVKYIEKLKNETLPIDLSQVSTDNLLNELRKRLS
mgnify:CR=1 FL=1